MSTAASRAAQASGAPELEVAWCRRLRPEFGGMINLQCVVGMEEGVLRNISGRTIAIDADDLRNQSSIAIGTVADNLEHFHDVAPDRQRLDWIAAESHQPHTRAGLRRKLYRPKGLLIGCNLRNGLERHDLRLADLLDRVARATAAISASVLVPNKIQGGVQETDTARGHKLYRNHGLANQEPAEATCSSRGVGCQVHPNRPPFAAVGAPGDIAPTRGNLHEGGRPLRLL